MGFRTLSETDGPLENLVQPLHIADRAKEGQEDEVIYSGSQRSRAGTQNFLDPDPLCSLNWTGQDACAHTLACYTSLGLCLLTALLTANTDFPIFIQT